MAAWQLPTIRIDTTDIVKLGNAFAAAGDQAPVALARALNSTGRLALTQMRRALVKQMGLPYGLFVRALKPKTAYFGNLEFSIKSRGGNISLKYFKARETAKGVSAGPRGVRTLYPGAFMKGGRRPNRVPLNLGGHVYRRTGDGRQIEKLKSDLYIPTEMLSGASRDAFETVVRARLPNEMSKALYAILMGVSKRVNTRGG